jgi:uncharacterized protein
MMWTRKKVLRFIGYTLLSFVGVILAALIAIMIIKPGPAGQIVIAAGGAGGLYQEQAKRFKQELAVFGVDVVVRPELEGITSLSTIVSGSSGVHAAFVKGGLVGGLQGRYATIQDHYKHDKEAAELRSVGRLFHEPMFVFYRGPDQTKRLREFKGRKILIGSSTSGARRVVEHILKANGIDSGNSQLIEKELSDDGSELKNGTADVAFVLLPPDAIRVQRLMRIDNVLLMDFSAEADAYVKRFPFLSKVILDQGSVEFVPNDIPSADITLLATTSALVVNRQLHPALQALLAYAAIKQPRPGFDKQGDPVLFHPSGEFPHVRDPEFTVSAEARTLHKTSELPFFLRNLGPLNKSLGIPFWVTAFAHRHGTYALLLLIPILSIAVPLARILPQLYNWSQRRRLLFWYRQLKALELDIDANPSRARLADIHSELDRIDSVVQHMKVPLHFSDQLYDLRGHVDLVRRRLAAREQTALAAAAE